MGNLLILNYGTFVETNRFKAESIQKGFLGADVMEVDRPPSELLSTRREKISAVRDVGVVTYSFYGIKNNTWRSNLSNGKPFYEEFKKWINKVLDKPVHCMYITGHHWGDGGLFLSWKDSTEYFHAEFNPNKKEFGIGTGRDKYLMKLKTVKLRTQCYLVVGFGCNSASGINSLNYQKFFGGSSRPFILGWDKSIGVPKRDADDKRKVSNRFFYYLEQSIQKYKNVPDKNRLKWFYQHQPMEIIKAWGYATMFWFRSRARARHKNGNFYKYKYNSKTKIAEPVLLSGKAP